MKMIRFSGVVLAMVVGGVNGFGQTAPTPEKPKVETTERQAIRTSCSTTNTCVERTFYLANASQANDGNEITTAIRNLLPPETRIYLVPSRETILVQGTAEQIAMAQKIINDLDKPKKTYRLTYTISEMDGGKKVSAQHFATIVAAGQRVTLKQGSRVPVATGSYTASAGAAQQTQFTYIDVGMNFDATLEEVEGGAELKSKVEQSGVAEDRDLMGVHEPVVRQTVMEGTSFLKIGKPLMLGSVDVPGSTRHLDIEVTMELVP